MSAKHPVITVENIAKVYRIGVKERMHDSLAGAVTDFIRSPLKNYRTYRSLYTFDDVTPEPQADSADVIWALKGVSFKVEEGEVLGIIGMNGAGKSTLLKILSRITPPTLGRAEIRGRVVSLLEVGTGFHQELTGRENVYLNGTVLGMKKTEVDAKFDEIVDFSGVEKFLDTPVKRYSSGMKVRLAFAVAAHLEPEILIVDEVLAVGDAAFQTKCLNKMQDVGQQGRTVLFVSHNMPAVIRLCSRCILLNEGRVIEDGLSQQVVSTYLNTGTGTTAVREWQDPATAPRGEIARLRAVRVVSREGQIMETADIRKEVGIQMEYEVIKSGFVLLPHFYLYNKDGVRLFPTLDQDPTWQRRPRPEGRYVSTAWIPGNFLAEGMSLVDCHLITRHPDIVQFREAHVVTFQVIDRIGENTARGDWAGRMRGVMRPLLEWTTEFRPKTSEAMTQRSPSSK